MKGWIRIHRQIADWQWYQDNRVKSVFIHLLILAGYKDGEGYGEVRESYQSIADALGMTIGEVRRSIAKLKETGEIETVRHKEKTAIKIVNYEKFQTREETKRKRFKKKKYVQKKKPKKENYDSRIPVEYRGVCKTYEEYEERMRNF